jgi:translation elongation factor EF-Ts
MDVEKVIKSIKPASDGYRVFLSFKDILKEILKNETIEDIQNIVMTDNEFVLYVKLKTDGLIDQSVKDMVGSIIMKMTLKRTKVEEKLMSIPGFEKIIAQGDDILVVAKLQQQPSGEQQSLPF